MHDRWVANGGRIQVRNWESEPDEPNLDLTPSEREPSWCRDKVRSWSASCTRQQLESRGMALHLLTTSQATRPEGYCRTGVLKCLPESIEQGFFPPPADELDAER
jgi:hypothetical protein